jgi:hypothetical protein
MANVGGELSIAYVDARGRELASEGGLQTIGMARAPAQGGLQTGIYPRATKVIIYRGRTLAEGEQLEEVSRER